MHWTAGCSKSRGLKNSETLDCGREAEGHGLFCNGSLEVYTVRDTLARIQGTDGTPLLQVHRQIFNDAKTAYYLPWKINCIQSERRYKFNDDVTFFSPAVFLHGFAFLRKFSELKAEATFHFSSFKLVWMSSTSLCHSLIGYSFLIGLTQISFVKNWF